MEEKKINTNASQKLTPDELGKIAGGRQQDRINPQTTSVRFAAIH